MVTYECPAQGSVTGEQCVACFENQKVEGINKVPSRAMCVREVGAVKKLDLLPSEYGRGQNPASRRKK